jgi:hypothetical protein
MNNDLSCKEEAFQAVSHRFIQLVSYLASLALSVIQVSVANADSWTTHQPLRILRRKTIIIRRTLLLALVIIYANIYFQSQNNLAQPGIAFNCHISLEGFAIQHLY